VALDAYAIVLASAVPATAYAAGSTLFSMRWTNPDFYCVIHRLRLGVTQATAPAVGAFQDYRFHIARNWTVSDSGGTVANLTGNNTKRSNTAITSLLDGGMRIHSATAITPGTRTLDADPVSMVTVLLDPSHEQQVLRSPDLVAFDGVATKYGEQNDVFDGALLLRANEGLVLLTGTSVQPLASSLSIQVGIGWGETR